MHGVGVGPDLSQYLICHFVRGPLNLRVALNKKISKAQGRAVADRSTNPSLN